MSAATTATHRYAPQLLLRYGGFSPIARSTAPPAGSLPMSSLNRKFLMTLHEAPSSYGENQQTILLLRTSWTSALASSRTRPLGPQEKTIGSPT